MRKRRTVIVSLMALILLFGASLVAQSGSASAMSPKPKISKFKASTKTIKTDNGTLTLSGKASNAETCTLSSSIPLAGLPTTVSCSSFDQVVELPYYLNSGVTYKFTLTAQGSSSAATKSVKVKVLSGEGGFVFPSKITGMEWGAKGIDGVTDFFPFDLTYFEFDPNGSCVGTNFCDYNEVSISGSGTEEDAYPGTCDQTIQINETASDLTDYTAEFGPDVNGIEHLAFEASTGYFSPCGSGSEDWGINHAVGDGYVNTDTWVPGSTSLSVTYNEPDNDTTGTIDFTFSYS